MPPSAPHTPPSKRVSSLIRNNHRIRIGAFAMGFAVFASHLMDKGATPLIWALVVLQFLIYPHVLYWRALKVADPLRAEVQHLRLEPLVLGFWSAVLGLPLWITVGLLNCALVSNIYFRDLRGALEALAAFAAGIALWAVLADGLQIDLTTSWPTTLLAIASFTAFITMGAHTAFARNIKLRNTRERLRQGEQGLNAANEALRQQLDEIHVLQARLSELANRDPLTGLYNRRYFDSTLQRELARCKREGQPLCLILIDVDHFKRINDTYGHPAGDEVIKALADKLSEGARTADVVCRYGGEEFMLLLPDMPRGVAQARAEQWRANFAATVVAFGEFRMQTTLSIGIACYPGHGTSPEELIRCADQALYRAKSDGRNRVVLYATPANE